LRVRYIDGHVGSHILGKIKTKNTQVDLLCRGKCECECVSVSASVSV
jgi:hypothetical protein